MPSVRRLIIVVALLATALAACSTGSARLRKTFEDRAYSDRVYDNVLVIAMAADYNARSRFELSLASALRSPATDAIGYHEIAPGDQEITRDKILAAIDAHGYDAVVVNRIGSSESEVSVKSGDSEAKVTRRTDRAVDFFRYDYEILNEPHQVNLKVKLGIITDFFDAADAKLIWTGESTVSDKVNIGYQLENTAQMIAQHIGNDGLVAR